MNKLLILTAISLYLTGCGAITPTTGEVKTVAGKKAPAVRKAKPRSRIVDLTSVKPANFDALATNYMNKMIRPMMKDPSSMKLTLSGRLEKEVCSHNWKKYRTWNTLVGINAKNSYGAYTGTKPYKLFFVDGKIVAHAYDVLLGSNVNGLVCVGMGKYKP